MIIFDEVHGTRKKSPYSRKNYSNLFVFFTLEIMLQYHRDKFSAKHNPGKKLPQVIIINF